MVRPLVEISLDALLRSIRRQRSLGQLPEELCLDLFERVLSHGKLTPEVPPLPDHRSAAANASMAVVAYLTASTTHDERLALLHDQPIPSNAPLSIQRLHPMPEQADERVHLVSLVLPPLMYLAC